MLLYLYSSCFFFIEAIYLQVRARMKSPWSADGINIIVVYPLIQGYPSWKSMRLYEIFPRYTIRVNYRIELTYLVKFNSRQTRSTGFRPKIDQENRLDFDLNSTSKSGRITSAHFDKFSTKFRLDFDVDFEETSAQKKISTRFRRQNLVSKSGRKCHRLDSTYIENRRRNQVKIWSKMSSPWFNVYWKSTSKSGQNVGAEFFFHSRYSLKIDLDNFSWFGITERNNI